MDFILSVQLSAAFIEHSVKNRVTQRIFVCSDPKTRGAAHFRVFRFKKTGDTAYSQGSVNQSGVNHSGVNQGSVNQSSFNQSGVKQSGINQSGVNQSGVNQGGVNQNDIH
jgi:hypothetical protein